MRRRVGITIVTFLASISAIILWQLLRLREPVYQGKRLSVWLQRYSSDADAAEVDEALRTTGTNAIPTLLENLRSKDSALRLKLASLGVHYTLAETRHMRAERGFRALGEAASNAVPMLIEIYEQNPSTSAREAAGNALVETGPAAKKAIPALIKSAANTNSDVRVFAVATLGRMGLESESVDPVLINALHDPDREVRQSAAFGLSTLSFMGGNARPAIPALIETLKDNYLPARCAAAMALRQIHAEPELVVPALVESLRDRDFQVRAHAANALEAFGTNSRPAVPALIELFNQGNEDARSAASKALRVIDLEAATKAGVK